MVLTKNNTLEIIVEGELLELSKNALSSLRLNNTLFTPTKISNKQASYSFSFDIPATPKNNKILGYGNMLSATNKFSRRYNCEVVADGIILFAGTMILNSYKDKFYNANLVNIKVLSLQDIFGESTLNELDWYVPFDGIPTINQINANIKTSYFFPLASYGVFQKAPFYVDEVAADYTSKFLFDKWNQWYFSSFYPSVNMLELVRQLFASKGYEVKGDVFTDPILKNIYLSTNLASEQVPEYNLGNEHMGTVKLDIHWSNGDNENQRQLPKAQDLTFGYLPMGFAGSPSATRTATRPNYDMCDWSEINIWDMLDSGNTFTSVTARTANNTERAYLYDANESVIIAPTDGFYEITLSAEGSLKPGDGGIKADHYYFTSTGVPHSGVPQQAEAINVTNCPLEIQLVRNYKEDETKLELIYGKDKQVNWSNGIDAISSESITTCFPHEDLYNQMPPVSNFRTLTASYRNAEIANNNSSSSTTENYDSGNTGGGGGSFGNRSRRRGHSGDGEGRRPSSSTTYSDKYLGYYYPDEYCKYMAYDPAVCDAFIAGLSTCSSGVAATRKNGRSWTNLYTTRTDALYQMPGYTLEYINSAGTRTTTGTAKNENTLIDSPLNTVNVDNSGFTGTVATVIWLQRGDVLSLKAVQRRYTNYSYSEHPSQVQLNYYWDVNATLKMRAITKEEYAKIKDDATFYYGMPSRFDNQLRLGNFLNSETTMASFVEDVQKAFNLDIDQTQQEITISRRRVPINRLENAVVDINNRINPDHIESKKIDYPSKFSVAYNINKDEFGFVDSCPPDKVEQDDWYKYADSGYSIVTIDGDVYNTNEEKITLGFSYDWYKEWRWYQTNADGTQNSGNTHMVDIPVISKDEYLIDEYKYDEAAKYDGYSLKQRMWFRQPVRSDTYFWSASTPREQIFAAIPVNHVLFTKNYDFNLSYKLDEKSILTEYFDVTGLSASNDELEIEVYLNAEEYQRLKQGSLVYLNDDLFRLCRIVGFDPSNNNKTKLTILKIGI